MFRSVIQRRAGRGSLIGLALLLVAVAATVSAVRPANVFAAAAADTCGYDPSAAPAPGGGTVVFNENTVTRAIAFYGVGLSGRVGVFTNDESGLYIGSGGTPSSAVAGQVYGEAVPPTFGSGSDAAGRPSAPVIYLTDITSNLTATGGDWENGGQPATTGASGLYGSWSPTLGTKPVNKNDWTLGPDADTPPAIDAFGGATTAYNEGYGSEVAWDVSGLTAFDPTTSTFVGLQPGHTYRAQSITHDTDQNKGQGDVGEVCTTFAIPAVATVQIAKTADAAKVTAGDPIGFTLTVSNSSTVDATGVTLSDPLPTNAGLSWSIDNQGSGWAGTCAIAAGTLNCGPETVPAGTTPAASTFTVHITSGTTQATGGTCPGPGVVDNTGTVDSTNAGSGQASASVCVKPQVFPPPSVCTAVHVRPKQLTVGQITTLHLRITQNGKPAAGVKVRIKGPGFLVITKKSNAKGKITQVVHPTRKGVATFQPIVKKNSCRALVKVGIAPPIVPVTG